MSLIKCPECGQDVSDKAKICPHCGYELPVSSSNVSVTQTETEVEPLGELVPAAPQAAAPTAEEAPAPAAAEAKAQASAADNKDKKSALGAYIDEITATWKKERRGEKTFGTIMALLFLIALGFIIGFAIDWLVTVGGRWVIDFHLSDNNLIHCTADLEKTHNLVAIIISFSALMFVSMLFVDFWEAYRIKAWAKRKGIDLKAELRARAQSTANNDKEKMVEDEIDGPKAAIFIANAYDRSPLRYLIVEIIRESLDSVAWILLIYAGISAMNINMQAALLQIALPVSVRAIILLVLSVAVLLLDPILRRICKKIVKGYYTASPAPSSPNTPQS